ncbi:succinate dehydrogenase iron-sulfur subunit [Corallococcus coralloides]|uniref:Succinate dehydrogenase iron-sulfur subunit n=1 Tax=Corallococcus coralloides TaxID=184914 RepID=A0A410S170_CORCK|nr:succinate dehydrogenase/fumarate reductase iron-sulfur subunit [Corallococcus coralloides]QAT87957.1 succinate dehydrogenase iron-sulfur subunit [Corallococcus coralloides]
MNLVLHIWRQKAPQAEGVFTRYEVRGITPEMSFLEMLDVLNERLTSEGNSPIAFESDCREGICGTCGFMIDGIAHGPAAGTAVCQLHMRHFTDGTELTLEPWRARAFPVLKDLVVDRIALDRIIAAGGFVTAPTGAATEANVARVPKQSIEAAMDAAACIGCGACVAACPNASAALFTGAKIAHLGLLPQGQPERERRAIGMVKQMDAESFGNCSWHGECQDACPKRISIDVIARMNRDYLRAAIARPSDGGDGS